MSKPNQQPYVISNPWVTNLSATHPHYITTHQIHKIPRNLFNPPKPNTSKASCKNQLIFTASY